MGLEKKYHKDDVLQGCRNKLSFFREIHVDLGTLQAS